MGHRVEVNMDDQTVTAVRTLRESGGSSVVTIPPQVLDALELENGDELEMVADFTEKQLMIKKRENT